jgi:hypothetical protein
VGGAACGASAGLPACPGRGMSALASCTTRHALVQRPALDAGCACCSLHHPGRCVLRGRGAAGALQRLWRRRLRPGGRQGTAAAGCRPPQEEGCVSQLLAGPQALLRSSLPSAADEAQTATTAAPACPHGPRRRAGAGAARRPQGGKARAGAAGLLHRLAGQRAHAGALAEHAGPPDGGCRRCAACHWGLAPACLPACAAALHPVVSSGIPGSPHYGACLWHRCHASARCCASPAQAPFALWMVALLVIYGVSYDKLSGLEGPLVSLSMAQRVGSAALLAGTAACTGLHPAPRRLHLLVLPCAPHGGAPSAAGGDGRLAAAHVVAVAGVCRERRREGGCTQVGGHPCCCCRPIQS